MSEEGKAAHHPAVPNYRARFLQSVLCGCCVVGVAARENAPVDLTTVWGYAADNQPIEARVALKKLDGLDARTRALAGAVLDMARPPLAEGDWNEIEPVLAGLAAGNDMIAAQAQYLRARMYQVDRKSVV